MKVRDIMKQPVVTVREDATLEEVAQAMLDHHNYGLPVVDDSGQVTGIITEADFAAKAAGGAVLEISHAATVRQMDGQGPPGTDL
jgi:acetoin utilization protein AcuB